MEPFEIIGGVAAIIQLAEFGKQLFSETAKLYTGASGTQTRITDLNTISKDLTDLTQAVEERMASVNGLDRPLSIIETALLEECRRCKTVSDEILLFISQMHDKGMEKVDFESRKMVDKAGKRGWEKGSVMLSFRTALKLVWNQKKINSMARRLEDAKSNLTRTMVSSLW